jgi:hypothetical protein
VGRVKKTYVIFVGVLIIFAWPFYYLYQRQLGAIPFLLLAVFFLVVTIKEVKRFKQNNQLKSKHEKKEKIKRNSR